MISEKNLSRALSTQNSCGQQEESLDESEKRIHGYPYQSERKQEKPDKWIEQKDKDSQRPAEKQ